MSPTPLKTIIAFLLIALAFGVYWDYSHRVWSNGRDSPNVQNIRDSVLIERKVDVIRYDSFVRIVYRASSDTLAAILRDRAMRPPVRIHDTIAEDTRTTTEDAGSSQLCEVSISCSEAQRLILRDSALLILSDSLQGDNLILKASIDSIREECSQKPTFRQYGYAIGTGYVAGILTCVLLK